MLQGQVAVVTGTSRGIGRGIADVLAQAGVRVYGIGRTIMSATLDPAVVRVEGDATDPITVDGLFDRVFREMRRVDILVNAAWGGYDRMVEGGRFTWPLPFWEQPLWRWDAMMNAGVYAAFLASRRAAQIMVPAKRGLIVSLSHWAAQKRIGSTIYGVSKAATDKLTRDMAVELQPHGVTAVSLYPGLVRTEMVMQFAAAFDMTNSESPEFTGHAIAALAADPNRLDRTGQVLVSAALAQEYGFTDIDGKQPRPLTIAEL